MLIFSQLILGLNDSHAMQTYMNQMSLSQFLTSGKCKVVLPDWVTRKVDLEADFSTNEARMRLAILLSGLNVEHKTGGPFGSAIFELGRGRLVGVGVNLVVPSFDPTAHGEITAFRVMGEYLQSFSAAQAGLQVVLYSSAEPCGMCRTGTIWAGVAQLYFAATSRDVEDIGFNEGVKERSWPAQFRQLGIHVEGTLLRHEAVAVLDQYKDGGGVVYNGKP